MMTFYPGAESFPHGTFPVYTFPKYTWVSWGEAGSITYTGIIYLTALARSFGLTVEDRDFDSLRVLPRDFALKVEDR